MASNVLDNIAAPEMPELVQEAALAPVPAPVIAAPVIAPAAEDSYAAAFDVLSASLDSLALSRAKLASCQCEQERTSNLVAIQKLAQQHDEHIYTLLVLMHNKFAEAQ